MSDPLHRMDLDLYWYERNGVLEAIWLKAAADSIDKGFERLLEAEARMDEAQS